VLSVVQYTVALLVRMRAESTRRHCCAPQVSKRETELPQFEEDLNREKHPDYKDRWEYVEEEVWEDDEDDDLYGDGMQGEEVEEEE
jgi:hypothetical protein